MEFSIQYLTSQGEYFTSFCGPILMRASLNGDKRPAREILDENYRHGGGWSPFEGFKVADPKKFSIKYPGDPTMRPHSLITFNHEVVAFYDSDWVAIWQPDGSFEICRMD